MKYIHVFNMIIIVTGLFVAFFAALRVIGMLLWVFGDSCVEQVEREREEC